MNTSKNRGNLGSVKLVLRCKSDTWSPQWKWQCRPHAGIIKHQLGLQMAHSQQSKIAFSLLCWTKLFSTRTLSWQEKQIQLKSPFDFIPLCPFLPCLAFISAVFCEACALLHPGTLLSQESPGADCFQAAFGYQACEWKLYCPSAAQRNCFHHLELCCWLWASSSCF